MRCTMKKCAAEIDGLTGLQELKVLMDHFRKKHKIALSMGEAARVRIDIEDGREPNLLGAMLGNGSEGGRS